LPKNNYKLTIKYDGTDFCGWQSQSNGQSVQNKIESALKIIFKNQDINLIASGRTDAGVHACGQVANVKIKTDMSSSEFRKALNGNLCNSIFVSECDIVEDDFHARFSAVKRRYEYAIVKKYTPFRRKYYWNVNCKGLNEQKLRDCASLILGEHDFTNYSKKNPDIDNKICHIYTSKWMFLSDKLVYVIEANRFLHHMVRYLVGTMIEVSKSNISINDFTLNLNPDNKKNNIFKAPSIGLFLDRVFYD
tara:strand:+ start:121 stop:864 length:744 start_codon:yes stop_codon:yes gene_type:complete